MNNMLQYTMKLIKEFLEALVLATILGAPLAYYILFVLKA